MSYINIIMNESLDFGGPELPLVHIASSLK